MKPINPFTANLIKKAAKKTLTKEERDENLKKFLEPSAVQMRLYHGTTATEGGKGQEALRQLRPSKEGALGSGVYMTPKTAMADEYTFRGSDPLEAGGNILPLFAQIKNPLILNGRVSRDPMIEALIKLGMDESKATRTVERAYENKGYIGKEVESRARAQGFDGLLQYDRDGSLSEVVSYNPSAIKSALGNEGTYDTSVPLLNKAEGGLIRMQAGGDPRGEMKASPQNPVLGALARGLRSAQNVVGQYQVDPRIPLVGGMGVDELLGIPGAAGLVEDVSYYGPKAAIKGGNVATGGLGTFTLDPRVVDVAGVAELGGLGVQAAKGAGKAVGQQLQRQLTASPLESQLGMARVNQVQAPVSKLGFYNPIEQAALNIQRKQGPGQAFLNEIQRADNVNKEFLQSSGIAQKLASMPKVTREEVQEMVKGSVPEVEQVMLGQTVVPPHAKEWLKVHMPDFDPSDVTQIDEALALANQRYEKLIDEGELGLAEFAVDAIDDLTEMKRQYKPGTKAAEALTKYGEYTIPGGENYREMLLTLPQKEISPEQRQSIIAKRQEIFDQYNPRIETLHQQMMRATDRDLYNKLFDDYERLSNERDIKAKEFAGEVPDKLEPVKFQSSHWRDQPNVLSHIRMNDRTDAEGKKVLFIEELQSDWAQEGRKRGFGQVPANEYQVTKANGEVVGTFDNKEQAENFARSRSFVYGNLSINEKPSVRDTGIPAAPFVQNTKDWVDLSLKNILKRAVDEGYDRVAFINGKQSADRYQLTNYVDKLEFVRTSGGVAPGPDDLGQGLLIGYDKSGHRIIERAIDNPEKQLPDYIGKEAAQKMLEQKPQQGRFGGMGASVRTLQGQGLEVGGTGMKKFYDEIVPERVRKLVGKNSLRDIQFEDKTAKLREELANATPGSSRYLYLTDQIGMMERDAERYGALGNQLGFDITPELREKFSAPIPYKEGGVVKLAGGGSKKLFDRAAIKVKEFVDPKTTKIEDWQWRPLAEVDKQLKLTEVPDYIQRGYGDFMIEQAKRAGAGQMGVRDLIKAYGITQSSIGRGGLSYETATKAGLKVPKGEGLVRPEGAFAEWLGSKQGQKFLDDAERGVVNEKALDDIRTKFAPFGKANQLTEQLRYGVNNMSTLAPQMQKALVGPADEYRDWAESMKGIAGAKSGFIGSMLGRGDLPTLDARQLNLHSLESPVSPQTMMQRGKGLGAREAVDRLAARQSALGLDIDPSLDPYYQHLAHHAVWDKVADEKTTHEDLMRALRGYKQGGTPDTDAMRLEMMRKSWRSK